MKLTIFKMLAKVNKTLLPSYKQKDLTKLSKTDKLIVGWTITRVFNNLRVLGRGVKFGNSLHWGEPCLNHL